MSIEQDIIDTRMLADQEELNRFSEAASRILADDYQKIITAAEKAGKIESEEALRSLIQKVATKMAGPCSDSFASSALAAKSSIDRILSWDGNVKGYNPVEISRNQLKGMALATRINGENLVGHFSDAVQYDVLKMLQENKLKGNGIKEASREIYKALGGEATRKHIELVVHDYNAHATSYAREITYAQNGNIIKGYKLEATLENGDVSKGTGTCPRCAALDQRIYTKDEPRKTTPFHNHCKCLYSPVTKDFAELGLDAKAMRYDYRRWTERAGNRKKLEGGTTYDSYAEYWGKKPEEWQNKAIGPRRADLIRRKLIKFEDIVRADTTELYTLKELKAKFKLDN